MKVVNRSIRIPYIINISIKIPYIINRYIRIPYKNWGGMGWLRRVDKGCWLVDR